MSVRRGERITLRCEADGDQPLDLSWRSKGSHIDTTYDIRYHLKNTPLSNKGIVSELTIVQTSLLDRGEYSCIASNAYGHDHSTIHLQVQEPPNFPKNLHINELHGRSVLLSWSSPIDSDGVANIGGDFQPITNYILQIKEAQDVWHDNNNKKLLPGDKTIALISSLKPATSYHFRLFAENHLGTSAPSDILHVHTDMEPPSGKPQKVTVEPLGAQQLLVTWRPPEREQWNGELLGYAIGYRRAPTSNQLESEQPYNYSRVGTAGGDGLNDFRLIGLDKYTLYMVTVQAFNAKGDGPPSDAVSAHTLEDSPSAPPQGVTCVGLTAQNLQISWQPPSKENIHGIIQGYKILYEPVFIQLGIYMWSSGKLEPKIINLLHFSDYVGRETKITSSLSTVLHGLQPYTNYTIQVLAYTRAGEGVQSASIICTTEEAVPDAPERIKSVVNSENSAIISWLPPRRPNGVLQKYTVYIRVLEKGQEVDIYDTVLPAQNHHYEAKDLKSRESYEAWITASTKIGQGPSTPVLKITSSNVISAAIISFGQSVIVAWRVDVKLACLFVGTPRPISEWRVSDGGGRFVI